MALIPCKPNHAPVSSKSVLGAPLDLSLVFSTPPAPMDFVLPGLLAGGIGMLSAPGGSGKTYLLLSMAASIAAGLPVAGGIWAAPETTGRVVLMAAEDPPEVLHHRLHAFAQNLQDEDKAKLIDQLQVHSLSGQVPTIMVSDSREGPREEWEWLRAIEDAAKGARLLVIDPIRRFHGGDENNSNDMTRLVQILEGIASRSGCAIVFSHHTGKNASLNGQGDMQQAARGSSALTDAVRWQANLVGMSKEEQERFAIPEESRKFWVRLAITKSNYSAPTGDMWLKRGLGGVLSMSDPSLEAFAMPAPTANKPPMKCKGRARD